MQKYLLFLALVLWTTNTFEINTKLAPVYNITASQQIVKLAAVAFCGQECLQSWTCKTASPLKLSDILYIDHPVTKVHGFVGYRAQTNEIVVSFRGTSNWQNWVEDANFQKIDYPNCFDCAIHAGFYFDYLSVSKSVNDRVGDILKKYPGPSIVTTGHSLGGALSAIAAIQLKQFFPKTKVQIHNFGQPRIGNKKLADYMSNKLDGIYRVVHNKDLVPHVPPDLPQFAYHHPAYQIYFNSDLSSYKVCNSSGEDKSCSNRFFPNYDPNDHDHYFLYISQTQC